MCKERINVVGLDNQRTAYEVEEFLRGIPHVIDVEADFLSDEVIIEYDETEIEQERVLDCLEYAGCKPSSRIDGLFDRFKMRLK